jgi:stress-induced morphogen
MLRRIITTTLAHARQYSSSPRAPAMEQRIRTQLESALQPVHYELVNESHKHSVPRGSETHFKVR